MKIALIGYGGMGKAVRRIAEERGHEVASIIDPHDEAATAREVTAGALGGANVAIDFSLADAVISNVRTCMEAGCNIVVGTTGWYDKIEEARRIVEGEGGKGREREKEILPAVGFRSIGFLWSSNFSIGVNLYFKIIDEAARLMNSFDEYDVWGHEIHHYNKADSPSGTAKTLSKILLDRLDRKTAMVDEKLNRRREHGEIHFSSVRGGAVNFAHTIGFDSAADRILITHEARNRDGYALGAVKAAEWLIGKRGFFGMEDFLKNL